VKPLITLDGAHEVNEVFFDDVRVPVANMIGEVDKGWTVAKYLLGHERMGGGALGGVKKLLSQLKDIARKEEGGFGGKLWDDQTFRRKVSESEIDLMALEVQMMRLLSAMSADREMGFEASMIKIRRSEILQRLSELKTEAVGYYGAPYIKEALIDDRWNEEPIGEDYMNALTPQYLNNRKHSIFAGSNEIQHNIIAKQMLGL
jgi:alkylation response protein AidB-like acyl-CoA dehydrogenase